MSFFSLRAILWFRLLFGFYFKCSNCIVIRLILKLYCIIFGVLVTVYSYVNLHVDDFIVDTILYIYNTLNISDVILNVLISLTNEETHVMQFWCDVFSSFPSTIVKRVDCRATYYFTFGSIFIRITCFLVFVKRLSSSFGITVIMYLLLKSYAGRITTIYLAEVFSRTVKVLNETLINELKAVNGSTDEKRENVKKYVDDVTKLTKNWDAAVFFFKVKVIRNYSKNALSILMELFRSLSCCSLISRSMYFICR